MTILQISKEEKRVWRIQSKREYTFDAQSTCIIAHSVCAAINGHVRTLADMVSQWFLESLGERPCRGAASLLDLDLPFPRRRILASSLDSRALHVSHSVSRIVYSPLAARAKTVKNKPTSASLSRETSHNPSFLVSSLNKAINGLNLLIRWYSRRLESWRRDCRDSTCHNLEIYRDSLERVGC